MTIEDLLLKICSLLEKIDETLKNNEKYSEPVPREPFFLTVKEYTKRHSWPSAGGMRKIIFNKKSFKAEQCFKKIGRRVLIDEKEFKLWIESNPQFNKQIDLMSRK
jgi:hypothetical protein